MDTLYHFVVARVHATKRKLWCNGASPYDMASYKYMYGHYNTYHSVLIHPAKQKSYYTSTHTLHNGQPFYYVLNCFETSLCR